MVAKPKQDIDGSKPLSVPKREAFAQELASGKTIVEAFVAAGYARGDTSNASRTAKRPDVAARWAWLRNRAASKISVTIDDIVAELNDALAIARKKANATAMVTAIMGKAKVLGLIIDRQVVGMKRIEDMNEAELRALLGVIEDGRRD